MTGTYRTPKLVLHHSAASGNTSYQIVTVANTDQMRDLKARHVGRFVEVTGPDSLKEVPVETLLVIFNQTRGDKPLDRFRDRQTAERRTFEVLGTLAAPYEIKQQEIQMAEAAAKETKAKGKKNKAAATEGGAAADAPAKERTPGVIATVREFLNRPEGGSIDEIVAECVKRFPDRTEEGMRNTAKIQSSRLAKSDGRTINTYLVQDRGRVYRFADVASPVELQIATPEPAEEPKKKPTKAQKANQEAAAETASVPAEATA